MWKAVAPIAVHRSGPFVDRVDIGGGGERYDIRFQSLDDVPRLLAGTRVGCPDFHLRMIPRIGGVRFVEEFAGGVIGNVEQFVRAAERREADPIP